MKLLLSRFLPLVFVTMIATLARAQDATQTLEGGWRVERPAPGVRVVLDENGIWGGSSDTGTTHQNSADYWIEKTLVVPAEALAGAKQARLRVLMAIQDYSQMGDPKKPGNGLDETFDLVVNGQSKTYADSDNFPGRADLSQPLKWEWHDFLIPVSQIKPGKNTFVFRKTAGAKGDDYLYIGIDNSIARGHSRISTDGGKAWRNDPINTANAHGEYLVRLLLLDSENKASATWTPQEIEDSENLIGFVGIENARGTPSPLSSLGALAGDLRLRMELDSTKFDQQFPIQIRVQFVNNAPRIVLRDTQNKVIEVTPEIEGNELSVDLPTSHVQPALIEIFPHESQDDKTGNITVKDFIRKVEINYAPDPFPVDAVPEVDLAPRIAAPQFKAAKRAPAARLAPGGFVLENGLMQMSFGVKPHLKLLSLRHELLGKNILAHPENMQLFLVEVGDKRFAAADWQVKNFKVLPDKKSVQAQLTLPEYSLAATLVFAVDGSTLRMKLNIANAGKNAQSWKTAFPQLGGLQLSQEEKNDTYLFPFKGGVIAALPANLRSIYGNNSAWWQMVDLFSPTGGAGISLRADDASGLYKSLALRKGITAAAGAFINTQAPNDMDESLIWKNSLAAAPGTAMTFEYLQRTRAPGQSFAPPDGMLQFHSGDWRPAMQEYSRWAHKAWKWRPFSPKLSDVWNVVSPGWGRGMLWQDGQYRLDYGDKNNDVWELYGWWNYADKAPWQVPFEDIEKLFDPKTALLRGHLVTNPATGKTQWQQNLGDYDGYHPEWGGLPAFQKYIQQIKDRGVVPMLYTCPQMADANTQTGKKYGEKYGIVNPLWKKNKSFVTPFTPENYVGLFYAWAMCPDNDFYPDYVANQMARVIRETGADGMRMDVWGYGGQACTNPQHKHLFAEPGHNAYLQASAAAIQKVRDAVDKEKPGAILTTEYSGADFMMHSLDGAIVYESSNNVKSYQTLRPVPVNLMRFYFPEFRPFDLDNLDPKDRVPDSFEFRFWNAMPAFGVVHSPQYHRVLKENGDAFNAPGAQPLVPTLQSRMYAHRFSNGDKTIWMLINGGQFTSDAPTLGVLPDDDSDYSKVWNGPSLTLVGFHYFDLLNNRELTLQGRAISIKLRPRQTAAIARFSRRITATKTAPNEMNIAVKNAAPNARLVLCDGDGAPISETKIVGAQTKIALPENSKAVPACVKLFEGKYLRDAAEWAQ
jgi:hypothetical protein